MRKNLQAIYIGIILVLMLIPLFFFNTKDDISITENRTLAKKPEFNEKLFSSCDSYIQDRFGGRNKFVKLANFIDYQVLNKRLLNERAFKGKNNFFYLIEYGDGYNIMDFYKKNLMTEKELNEFEENIKNTIEWCKTQKINYLFVIAPNKHSVYPENYLSQRPEGVSRIDQLISIMDKLNAEYIYPKDLLIEKKTQTNIPLYYETDTHWNPLGAYYVFKEIQDELNKFFPDVSFPEIEYDTKVEYSYDKGDIIPMLGIDNAICTRPELNPKNSSFEDYYECIETKNRFKFIKNKKFKNLPKAIIFGDSFLFSIEPYLPTIFSETQLNWTHFCDDQKEYVLKTKPDVIIFEKVERVAPWCMDVKSAD